MNDELNLLLKEISKEYYDEVINGTLQNDIDLLELLNKFTSINYMQKDNIFLMNPKDLLLILYAIDKDKNKYLADGDEPATFNDLNPISFSEYSFI